VENVTKPKTQLDLRLGNSMLKKCGWRRAKGEVCANIGATQLSNWWWNSFECLIIYL